MRILDTIQLVLWGAGAFITAASLALAPLLLRRARSSRARAGVFAGIGLVGMLWGFETPRRIPDPFFTVGLIAAFLGLALFAAALIYIFRRPLIAE